MGLGNGFVTIIWKAEANFVFFVELRFRHAAKAGLKFLSSDNLLTLASQCSAITGVSHYAWSELPIFFSQED